MGAILIFLLFLISELYVWSVFVRQSMWLWQVAYWLPFVSAVTLMTLVRTPFYQDWMFRWATLLILVFIAPKLIFTLISCIGWLVQWILRLLQLKVEWGMSPFYGSVHALFNSFAVVFVAFIVCIVAYGTLVGWKQLAVREVTLECEGLPKEFDGYRIVHLSDLHLGTYRSEPEAVDKIVSTVNEQNADMICFTGDLVNSSPEELRPFVGTLSKIKSKDGVFSIMGNHDYCMYRRYDNDRQRLDTIAELQRLERKMGWQLLLNENRIVKRGNASMMLAGVENSSKPPFPDYGKLDKALAVNDSTLKDADLFTVLLSHDPTHWRREVLKKSNVQLTLSGHTHATQFRMFGWTPAQHIYDEWGGLYSEGARHLFVSTGTGGNVAFRFGVVPEIVVIKLSLPPAPPKEG